MVTHQVKASAQPNKKPDFRLCPWPVPHAASHEKCVPSALEKYLASQREINGTYLKRNCWLLVVFVTDAGEFKGDTSVYRAWGPVNTGFRNMSKWH